MTAVFGRDLVGLVAVLALTLGVVGCGGGGNEGGGGGGGGTQTPPPPAQPTRSYLLASTGAQLVVQPPGGFMLRPLNLAEDVDVVSIHEDFYGVPWDEFEQGTAPPAAWVAVMDRLAADAAAMGKPVFLSLALVGGPSRHYLSDKAVVENGQLRKVEAWSAECFDFATAPDGASKRDAYLRYVEWMIDRFSPRWLNVAIEMNSFMPCASAWDGLVDVERAAYETAKARNQTLIVFPSIQIDALYGYNEEHCSAGMSRDACFDNNYQRLARVRRDRFAISTYPFLANESIRASLPADWFTRAAARGGERVLVAETGWLAANAVGRRGDECVVAIEATPARQLDYFNQLTAAAQANNFDLVTWWSNRDLIDKEAMTDCPCDFNASWCAVIDTFRQTGGSDATAQFYGEMFLKIFGTMGLREYDGTPRQDFMNRWQAVRQQPVR